MSNLTVNAISVASISSPSGNVAISGNTLSIGTAAYFIANGNLGIGNSSPAYAIDVFFNSNNSTSYIRINNANTGSNTYSGIITQANNVTNLLYANPVYGGFVGPSSSGHHLNFLSNNVVNAFLAANGNLGIGTSTPTGKLDVVSRGITKGSMPAGTVLQVQSVIKTDQFTTTSGTAVDITGMSVSITPTLSSSKILVMVQINVSLSGNGGDGFVRLLRDATEIGSGNGGYFAQIAGQDYYQVHSKNLFFIDSPNTTSAVTYKVQGWRNGNTLYVNGRGYNGEFVTSSQIIVMEIAQ